MDAVQELDCETDGVDAALLTDSAPSQSCRSFSFFIGPKRALALLLIIIIVFGAWYLHREEIPDPALVQNLVRDYPASAPVISMLIYTLCVVSGLPTLPINLAAGLFWGPFVGGLISTTGATLGAIVAFGAARLIFGRPLARRFDNRLIAQFQREFEQKGWRFIAFVRLNPAFPTGPLNYILGLTGVDFLTYAVATFVFLLPPSIAIALIGHSVGSFVVEGEIADSVKLIILASAAVTFLMVLTYIARLLGRVQRALK